MEHLQRELDRLLGTLPDTEQIRTRLDTLVSVYRFNEYEFVISHLLARGALSLDQYLELRDNYHLMRSKPILTTPRDSIEVTSEKGSCMSLTRTFAHSNPTQCNQIDWKKRFVKRTSGRKRRRQPADGDLFH
jgi:hypothetical protein